MSSSVSLVTGSDAVLVSAYVSKLINSLAGNCDRSLAVTQVDESDMRDLDGGWSLAVLANAAQSPPLFTERRVVVGRHMTRFARGDGYKELLRLISSLIPTTDLVLVWERGQTPAMVGQMPRVPKQLTDAIGAVRGDIINTNPPAKKGEGDAWVKALISESDLRFEAAAVRKLLELVGEDRSLVVGCLRTLEGALGAGAKVSAEDISIYGGAAGSTVPWALDAAIDKGDAKAAINLVHRQLAYRHPFQIAATLNTRYQRMLRLDGANIVNQQEAAKTLGMKGSSYPAQQLLMQSRRLGSQRIAEAIELLAKSDLRLRGKVDWPHELILEVLVAELAWLSRRPHTHSPRARRHRRHHR